jgi:GTP pyrophosphokinase
MGMQALREELEELAFKWLNPEAYQAVVEKLRTIRDRNSGLVAEILQALNAKLAEEGIVAEIKGREKKPYSIWRKMSNKQIGLELLSDIYGFRIVVDSIENCYRLLGVVHTTWRAVPGRFKDYISTPKQNGYRSLHTTVVGPRHQRVELQLRTQAMHQIAEYGVAAHALYKDAHTDGHRANGTGAAGPNGGLVGAKDSEPYMWLRRLVQTLLEGDNPEEFLEHTKLELFQDQVFCFTPKGRLIALPRGATSIDFAYAVHTDIGNNCIGAVINGRQMPLTTQLRNGDEVEVLLAKGQTPPAAWEHIAVTGKARSAIRRAARDALRKQYSELGRRLLSSASAKFNLDYSDDRLRKVLPKLVQKSVDDVLAAVGRGELPVADVIKAIAPDAVAAAAGQKKRPRNLADRGEGEEGWFNLGRTIGLKFRWVGGGDGESAPAAPQSNVPLRGLKNDVPVSFEPGGAVPGDRIVGVLIPGEGIRVFQIHSPRLKEFEHARWIDVTWDVDGERQERFPAKLRLVTLNDPGSLAQIAAVIGQSQGNIDNLRMTKRTTDFTEMTIEIEVWDIRHLNEIITGIKSLDVVSEVERSFD